MSTGITFFNVKFNVGKKETKRIENERYIREICTKGVKGKRKADETTERCREMVY